MDLLLPLSLLFLLLERWVKNRNAWTKVSRRFLEEGGNSLLTGTDAD